MKRFGYRGGAFLLLLALIGCASPTSSGTAKAVAGYVKGVITAKGSVWVNGVEYQTSSSAVKVDGTATGDTALKVGMTVELNVTVDPTTGKGTAQAVNYESAVKGPVTAGSIVLATATAPGSFQVLGQTVHVSSTTVFDGTTDLTTLATSTATTNFVEVSGAIDPATKALVANLVEVKTAVENEKLKGAVSSLNTSSASFTLTTEEGTAFTVGYTGTLDAAIANGSAVRVQFPASSVSATSANTLTGVPAANISVRKSDVHPDNGDHGEVEGVVAGYTAGDPATFTVDGQSVSAAASLIPSLSPAFGNDVRVEVEGTLSVAADGSSVLTATKIHAKKPDSDLAELKGTVTAVDLTAGTFTVQPAGATAVVLAADASTIFHDPAWYGTDPLNKLVTSTTSTTGDAVEVKYFVDTTVTPNVNRAVKVERQ